MPPSSPPSCHRIKLILHFDSINCKLLSARCHPPNKKWKHWHTHTQRQQHEIESAIYSNNICHRKIFQFVIQTISNYNIFSAIAIFSNTKRTLLTGKCAQQSVLLRTVLFVMECSCTSIQIQFDRKKEKNEKHRQWESKNLPSYWMQKGTHTARADDRI